MLRKMKAVRGSDGLNAFKLYNINIPSFNSLPRPDQVPINILHEIQHVARLQNLNTIATLT